LLGLLFTDEKATRIVREDLPMPMPKKITARVLKIIPTLIERGMSPAEIAARVGCTSGTLRVACSKAKISLRKRESDQARPSYDTPQLRPSYGTLQQRTHHWLLLKLPEMAGGKLRQEAGKRGLAVGTFASMLLEVIAQDNLYEAVLDEGEAHRPPTGLRNY
jgi:hypothetical protein